MQGWYFGVLLLNNSNNFLTRKYSSFWNLSKLENELTKQEEELLNKYVYSFRKTFFNRWETPEAADGVWLLKYKGTILRTIDNSEWINEKIKILILLLKLHISYDFFNPWMNHIDIKSFNIFHFNLGNNFTNKFWNMSECDKVYSTIPENLSWLNPKITDLTKLYRKILKDEWYYRKFLSISNVYYWLEHQNDLFFYYAIIPSILEVLRPPNINEFKKQKAIDFWKELDELLIEDNDIFQTVYHTKNNWVELIDQLWLIARTISQIYNIRNDFLHEWKKDFNKLKTSFHWLDLSLYDIFQLILKYIILNDFLDKWIINSSFSRLKIGWNIFDYRGVSIESQIHDKLHMDNELDWLLEKAESDKQLKQWLYSEKK